MPEEDDKSQRWREIVSLVKSRQPAEGQTLYYVVNFHADGGNGPCVPGRRTFTNREIALLFAEGCRDEPGHFCGPDSVSLEVSETDLGNEGLTSYDVARLDAARECRQHEEAVRRANAPWWRRLIHWLETMF